MAYKQLNFDIFKLSAFDLNQESVKFENVLVEPERGFSPLPKDSGSIILIGRLEKIDKFIYGTLAHKQMNYLPPSLDDDGTVSHLPLTDVQGLGYWNSFLFDPDLQMVVFESNRSGSTLKAFCDYFSYNHRLSVVNTEYVIDPVERERFNRMGVFKKLEIKVARVENGTIFNAERRSVSQVMNAADDTNATTLECTLAAGRYESLSSAKVRDMIKGFIGYKETEELETLTLTGKEDEGDKNEVIDFIGGRIRISYSVERKRFASEYGLRDKYIRMSVEYAKIRSNLVRAYKLVKI